MPPHHADFRTTSIRHQLDGLTRFLSDPGLPPERAVDAVARILDPDKGVLVHFTDLVAAASRFARTEAERGALPAEIWLALGRAANELRAIGAGLEEHVDALRDLSGRIAPVSIAPPAAAPLVVRRRR
ncbi:hypothetical protein [Streptomyces fragilis]|uniref:Uncharacterized protein n=1 Tax=Streptomyces fragilis TaxID=67301 RepID=A0ABV2YCB4_9ACTN|nr:hypothetical protein [Streptomyces fragilis]